MMKHLLLGMKATQGWQTSEVNAGLSPKTKVASKLQGGVKLGGGSNKSVS